MSAHVDVLAVMEAAADRMEHVLNSEDHYFENYHPDEMRRARVAVANLIDAIERQISALRFAATCANETVGVELIRRAAVLDALLSSCKGAQA